MKTIAAGFGCYFLLVVGCAASAPPPASPDSTVSSASTSSSAPTPAPQASPSSSSSPVPCSPEVVADYCPEDAAPKTCSDADGKVESIQRCSAHGGHCNGKSCIKGPAACDAVNESDVETGVACSSRGLSCTWMSLMGNAWCSCGDNGKWNCGHAGI